MAIQLSTARTSLENLKKDLSDVPQPTFVEWCNFVAREAYNRVTNLDPERYLLQVSFVVSAEPQTSTLPTDFRNILPLGCGFFEVDDNGKDSTRKLSRTGFGSHLKGYYIIAGNQVVFTGMNNSQTIRLRYIPQLTQYTQQSDFFTIDGLSTGVEVIEEDYLNYIVKALDTFYTQWDEVPGSESLADFRFVRIMDEMMSTLRTEPYSLSIPDFSNSF